MTILQTEQRGLCREAEEHLDFYASATVFK